MSTKKHINQPLLIPVGEGENRQVPYYQWDNAKLIARATMLLSVVKAARMDYDRLYPRRSVFHEGAKTKSKSICKIDGFVYDLETVKALDKFLRNFRQSQAHRVGQLRLYRDELKKRNLDTRNLDECISYEGQ